MARKILLLNFYQPPPLYDKLFSQLRRRCQVTEVQLASEEADFAGIHHKFPTMRAEFHHVARWAKQIIDQDSNAHIGLIGELGEAQRSELERILAAILDRKHLVEFDSAESVFNSTHTSQNLVDEGMVHDAFLLFDILKQEQSAVNFSRLLRSTYVLPEGDEWENRFALDRTLRERVNLNCQLQDILYYAGMKEKAAYCPSLHETLSQLREHFRRLPQRNSPNTWADVFSEILTKFQWPGPKLTTHQRKVADRFQNALNTFSSLTPILGAINHARAVSSLRRLCMETGNNLRFNHKRQISLYSIEEANGLDFDHVWLLNFNDQVWPPSINPSPFLPYNLQKDAGIPGSHSDVQFQFAEDSFKVLCQSVSGSLHSSHHCNDGEQEYRPSNFSKLFATPSDAAIIDPTPHCFYGQRYRDTPVITTVADRNAVALNPEGESLGGHQVLSDQSSCPFRAFARYRLHARELDQFASGLSPMARGSAIHEALEYLFKQVADSQVLHQLSQEALDRYCEEAAATAIKYLRTQHNALMTPRFEQIERARIVSLLKNFLQKEKERQPFTAIAWEQKQQWRYRDMLFHLKIDRVDRLADDSLAVIDYKTGKTSASLASWLRERPEDLQLPFYTTVMERNSDQTVHAVAIAHVNAEEMKYSGIMESDQFHPKVTDISSKQPSDMDWEALIQHFESVLHRVADEFHAGLAAVNPANPPSTCRYCDYHALCRIQEHIDLTIEPDDLREGP